MMLCHFFEPKVARHFNAGYFFFQVKEEPLSEEDMRAVQKDRQKKDNHNMSELE